MNCEKIIICWAILILPGGLSTQAIMTYSDKSIFLAETGASLRTELPPAGVVLEPITVGDITFASASGISSMIFRDSWTTRLPGVELAISGNEDLDVDFSEPVYAVGFDFVEPEFDPHVNAPFYESTFEVTLKRLGTVLDGFVFSRPNDMATFVGVQSDTPFDRLEIREIVGGVGNEFFGQFYLRFEEEPIIDVFASQRNDDSKLVDIYYDLIDANDFTYNVSVEVSNDNGAVGSWTIIPESFLEGSDIGPGITPGTGKHIIWDCKADLPGEVGSNYKIRVIADDGN